MTKETIIENEFITLWFHPDSGIVQHWINPAGSQSDSRYRQAHRSALEKGIELFKDRGANKWLSDDRNFKEQSLEDVEWGQKYWAPKAVVAGWRYWAIVMPDDVVSKMSLNHLVARFAESGVFVKVFPNTEDALAWLESK